MIVRGQINVTSGAQLSASIWEAVLLGHTLVEVQQQRPFATISSAVGVKLSLSSTLICKIPPGYGNSCLSGANYLAFPSALRGYLLLSATALIASAILPAKHPSMIRVVMQPRLWNKWRLLIDF